MKHADLPPEDQAVLAKIRHGGMRSFVANLLAHRPDTDKAKQLRAEASTERLTKMNEIREYDWRVFRRAQEGEFGTDVQAMATGVSGADGKGLEAKQGRRERRAFVRQVQELLGLGLK